jgi:2-haloacid dehalogenase
VAFDIYGTVVDTAGIADALTPLFGVQAKTATHLWREKQLEFTFRRGLMHRYLDFDTCTRQALRLVSAQLGAPLEARTEQALLERYLRLPAFADVKPTLETLQAAGTRILALTNGTARSVRSLLGHAGLGDHFERILSADEVQTFKPDPAVYELLKRAAHPDTQHVWLVSANPFDVIGAKACGLRAAWLRRDAARVFDPWEFSPDVELRTLAELPGELQRRRLA